MPRSIAKDYDEKRNSILKAAAKVFAEDGFDRASMNNLSKACNFSKAAIYHYYSSKEVILFDILETYLIDLNQHVSNLVQQPNESPEDFLSRIVFEILIVYRGAEKEHQILMNTNIINNLDEQYQKAIIDYQKKLVATISKAIQNIAPETFNSDQSMLRSATMSLFAMLNWYSMWNSGRGLKARETYSKFVSSLFIRGIKQLEND